MNSEQMKEETPEETAKEVSTEENTKEPSEPLVDNAKAADPEVKKEKKNKYKEQIAKLENELAKTKDEYLRARAEMENTKRRLNDEAIKNRKYASQGLVSDLLNPVDMLVKVANMENANPEISNFLVGFKMISNQIIEILINDGLKEIEALGKDFDPTIHHAVSKEASEGLEPNKVIEVLQTGYMYKDRVIKPAMVKVSE